MNIVYVSPDGNSSNAGTAASPVDLATGLSCVTNTGTIYMQDGIYRVTPLLTVQCGTVCAAPGAIPIITSTDDTPPSIDWKCDVNGIWMGGTRESAPDSAIFVLDDKRFTNNTLFGYYQCISEGGHRNILYQYNRFVNCGGGGLYHDIYISGANSGAKVWDNIFVGGEGYKIHLWHSASNVDIQRNFCGGEYGWHLVLPDINSTANDNVLWNHVANPAAFLTVNISAGTFTHNLFGHQTFGTGKWDQDMNNGTLTVDRLGLIGDRYTDTTTWEGQTVEVGPYNGDGHVLPAPGTNYTHYALTDLPTLLGYSKAQVNAAVSALEASFAADVATIHNAATIEGNFTILRNCVDAWKVA